MKFSQSKVYEKAFYYSLNSIYQNLTNMVNLPFYQDFIFVWNLNAVQQVPQFAKKVFSKAASSQGIQL